MFKFLKDRNRLNCFSPEVMLGTFLVEIAMAAYVFVRYKLSLTAKLVVAILLCLAIFQAVEYKICGGNFDIYLAKIGFIAITMLPPLGLHLISRIAQVKNLIKIGYFFAGIFIFHIIFSAGAISNAVCSGNYIIFETTPYLDLPYGLYYFILLAIGMWICIDGAFLNKKVKRRASALFWMLIGYLSFMFPMAVLYMWNRDLLWATASVMCGFAVIFAIILTFKVLSAYNKRDIRKY
ncbi:hypothetical protein ACFLY0_02265 [Patescibacteria group bacterium]